MTETPVSGEQPPFAEPWQAEAFAMVVALHQRGVFTWAEWAEALSREVSRKEAALDGHDYYEHWLAALEALLARKGIAERGDVDALSAAWQRAAHATPHGKPIELANDPGREVIPAIAYEARSDALQAQVEPVLNHLDRLPRSSIKTGKQFFDDGWEER